MPLRRLLRVVGPALALLAFWLAVTGSLDRQHLVFGGLVVAVVLLVNRDLAFEVGEAGAFRIANLPRLIVYTAVLLAEVVKANVQVAYIVLHPRLPVDPCLVIYHVGLEQEATRTLLANSITLTPGTLTVDLHGADFVVHALTGEAAGGLPQGPMERRLVAMERAIP
ncbi:MAG: Na+/H+ antiporter subunit E [bacterium]|nr:Na+/H+ antiporter subunit E [bacterium]